MQGPPGRLGTAGMSLAVTTRPIVNAVFQICSPVSVKQECCSECHGIVVCSEEMQGRSSRLRERKLNKIFGRVQRAAIPALKAKTELNSVAMMTTSRYLTSRPSTNLTPGAYSGCMCRTEK